MYGTKMVEIYISLNTVKIYRVYNTLSEPYYKLWALGADMSMYAD
jgi:hypothetical protein